MSDVKQIDSSAINRIKTLNTNIISNFSTSSASKPTNTESVAIDIDLEKASNPITEFFSNLKDDASDVGAYISDSVESITKYEWFQDFTDFAMDNVLPIVSKVGEVIARTGATVGTVVASLIEGILGFGGSLIDLVAIVGSAVLSIPTGIIDGVQAIGGLITGDDWDSVTKALWGKTKGFVETKYVENLFDSFYDTKVGKALKDNAYFFDTTRSIGTGVGNIAGTVALTVLTFGVGGAVSAGGSAASAAASSSSGILSSISSFVGSMSGRMAITAAASGIGKGTEEAWSEGASIGEGLVSGGLTGLWEGIQFYLGGKIGNLKVFGKSVETAGTKLANSLSRVILDGIDGGAEGIVQPLIASVYKDGYYDEDGNYIKFKETDNIVDKYGEIFDDYGGVKNILTNAAIGSGASILGEVLNIGRFFNKESGSEITAPLDSGEEITVPLPQNILNKSVSREFNLKEELLSKISLNMNNLQRMRKLYIELNKRLSYDLNYRYMDTSSKARFYDTTVTFDNLDSNKIICKGWSELFSDLLVSSGLDANKVKIVGGSTNGSHKWVEVDFDDYIVIADATDVIKGSLDLSNCKAGMKTNGFLILPKAFSSKRPSKIDLESFYSPENLKSMDDFLTSMDIDLGYATKNGYLADNIKKANTLFSRPKASFKSRVNKIFSMEIPPDMNGHETYAYYKNLNKVMFTEDELKNIKVSVSGRKVGSNIEGVTTFSIIPETGNPQFLVYSESTGKHIFNDFISYQDYISQLDLISLK